MLEIRSLRDAVKDLAQSLQVATIFPAALIVIVNAYLILPVFLPDVSLESSTSLTFTVSLTLLFSYTFHAFNYPLIRLFEGYKFRNTEFFPCLWKGGREKFKDFREKLYELEHEIDEIKASTEDGFRSIKIDYLNKKQSGLYSEFEMSFPSDMDLVLPTRFGNIIAAFEDYSRTRYGMDSIAIWPRLVPLLKENEYLAYVTQEKAIVDFLLNTCVAVSLVGLELFYYCLYLGQWIGSGLVLVGSAILVVILYEGMVRAAAEWGATIRVAFDLFRDDLHYALGLQRKETFESEFKQWQIVSAFFNQRKPNGWKDFSEFLSAIERIERVAK
jgi:hypothetical protein